jgi:hypothetical protein
MQSAHDNDSFLPDDHTVPIMEPERLQEAGSYLTLDEFDKMTRLFAMPAEDFPPATPSQCLSVRFCRDIELKGARLVNLYPCSYYQILLLVDKTLDSCAFFFILIAFIFFCYSSTRFMPLNNPETIYWQTNQKCNGKSICTTFFSLKMATKHMDTASYVFRKNQ